MAEQKSSDAVLETRPDADAITKRRHRIYIVAAILGVGVVLASAGVVWLADKASTIKTELTAANQLVPELRDHLWNDDVAAATKAAHALQSHTAIAREAATDPLWTLAGELPWLGVNFKAAREVTASADDVARLGVVPLVTSFGALNSGAFLPSDGALDLQPLVEAQPKIQSAAHAVRQSSDRLNTINADALLPEISRPLLEAREELNVLRDGLDASADVIRLVPDMLGHNGPRQYLLLVQNNAELRATGGIPGALAVMKADKGRLSLTSQMSASALGTFSPVVDVDAEQRDIYSGRLGKFMQDVNLTPDFPTAAQTAHAMWSAKTGQQLDGVLALDPIALSYVLDATGPVRVSDPQLRELAGNHLPTELTAENVVPTLLSEVYSKISEPALHDEYFAGVAKEIFSEISAGSGDTKKLIDGITRGTSEGRILLWSRSSKEQSVIVRNPISGSISGHSISPAQFGVYFNDGTGAKMDYYIKRTVQLVEECPSGGYGQVKVRVTSTNSAPKDAATALPDYVTGAGAFGVPEGTVQTNIVAYGPVQANVESVLADGKKIGFASQAHSGRPVGTVTVALPPGKSSTVEFLFGEIVQHTEPQLSVTPTVQPLKDVALGLITETCVPAP